MNRRGYLGRRRRRAVHDVLPPDKVDLSSPMWLDHHLDAAIHWSRQCIGMNDPIFRDIADSTRMDHLGYATAILLCYHSEDACLAN